MMRKMEGLSARGGGRRGRGMKEKHPTSVADPSSKKPIDMVVVSRSGKEWAVFFFFFSPHSPSISGSHEAKKLVHIEGEMKGGQTKY